MKEVTKVVREECGAEYHKIKVLYSKEIYKTGFSLTYLRTPTHKLLWINPVGYFMLADSAI